MSSTNFSSIRKTLLYDTSVKDIDLIDEAKLLGIKQASKKDKSVLVDEIMEKLKKEGSDSFHTSLFDDLLNDRPILMIPTEIAVLSYDVLKQLDTNSLRDEIENQELEEKLDDISGKENVAKELMRELNIRKRIFPVLKPLEKLLSHKICNPKNKILFKVHMIPENKLLSVYITPTEIETMTYQELLKEMAYQKIPVQGIENKKDLSIQLINYFRDSPLNIKGHSDEFINLIKKQVGKRHSNEKSTNVYITKNKEKIFSSRNKEAELAYPEPLFL